MKSKSFSIPARVLTGIHARACLLVPVAMATISGAAGAPESEPLANGLTRAVVAREPMLKNPIVVSVDVDGSIYVAETARRVTSDLDIRQLRKWIPQTLALRSVEERQALYEREFVPGKIPAEVPAKDWNGDGVVDSNDLTVISEKIHRLTDTDGDGIMDQSKVYAEGFNTKVTGIGAGVLAWRGDVYAAIIPDVWKLRDTTGDGVADQREALLTGFGVHVAYAGHDMHGLILGPDGKLYWTIGDKGLNVVSKEGKRSEALAQGAVLRCNPDGTGFEVYARGLRNVQQIAFDDYGNIFGVDNDADHKGEKERLLFIAEDSDTGWRSYYQYRGSAYNPWMAESMSVPSGSYQPAHMIPPLCNYMDGPSGFARDPGTALNEKYRGSFFVTGFGGGFIYSFKVEPDGAGFRMKDSHVVDKGPAYVGCNFGPDGALYLADWAGDYPLKEKGRVVKLDDPKEADSPLRREVAAMLKAGPSKVPDAALLQRLKHADQRIRCDAQWELAKRPGGTKLLAVSAAQWKEQPLACTHALWGLSQAKSFSPGLLKILLSAKAANTRGQAAKWAGETAGREVPELIALLKDPDAGVRYRAAVAIGKLRMTGAGDAVSAMLADASGKDAYLRHAGVLALTGMEDLALENALKHPSPAVRLAAAVAARRKGFPGVATLLADSDPAVVNEAARAIYDDGTIVAALPDLAALVADHPAAEVPAIRRSIAANRLLADEASAARLTAYAKDSSRPAELRVAALEALASWSRAVDLDLVDGRWHPLPKADASLARKAFTLAAKELEHDRDASVAKAAGAAAKALGIVADAAELEKDITDTRNPAALRLESLGSLKTVAAERFQALAPAMLKDASADIRKGTAALLADQPAGLAYLLEAARKATDLPERQNAIALLAKSSDTKARGLLLELLGNAETTPAIQLDLLNAAAGVPGLQAEAQRFTAALAATGPLGPSMPALAGGDAARGKEIFETHLAAACTACHRIGETGSNVGPPLTAIGTTGRQHILESLVLPQAKIAPGFGMTSITKKDGTTLTAAPVSETTAQVVVLLPDGKQLTLPKADIASQTPPVSPMPPMGTILKPAELRDLVEYLSTLK
jgi:quinoprotein glucose dehydrogenase